MEKSRKYGLNDLYKDPRPWSDALSRQTTTVTVQTMFQLLQ